MKKIHLLVLFLLFAGSVSAQYHDPNAPRHRRQRYAQRQQPAANQVQIGFAQAEKHQLLIEGETNIEIHADKNRLEQVLVNLLSNAIKYSPGAEKVIIKVTNSDDGVKIAVTDFGIGIPKIKQQYLFDRFYRVDDSSQRYAGLGLGLYISSEIVRQHHGHINIESEEGKGSTFWFVIPK